MALTESIGKIRFKYLNEFFNNIRGLPYAIVKGEALSILAYQYPYARHLGDIDILVSRKELSTVTKIMTQMGFVSEHSRKEHIMMLSASHQVAPWTKEISIWGKVIVDLNFDVFWGEYEGRHIDDIDEFLSDIVEIEIYGVKVKNLPPLKTIIQLVLHHYKDMNSIFLLATRKSIKYDMFKDVYYLLKNNLDTITLDKLYAMSAEYKIIPYVFYVLYYTGQVFEDAVLRRYTEAFRTPEGQVLLNCYGLCDKERKEWKYDFKTQLESDELYSLIRDDLNEHDLKKNCNQ